MKTNKVTGSRGVMYICGFFLNFDYCEIVFQYNLFSSAIGKVVSIKAVYKEQHKNYDYAITSILDNFDPECYLTCFGLIKDFELDGEKCDINIGDKLSKRIAEDLSLDIVDDRTIELLLWVGALFPEV